MSNNKYIIDKDSLTGIADAVRNKLGVGEATTDPQTGDIVYPEDKGYYLKEDLIAKISGFGWSETGYSGNFTRDHAPLINDENWNEAVGEPWYSVEITLVKGKGNFYDMDVSYTGGSQNFTKVTSSTYTVSAPNGSTYFNLCFSNKYNPNVSYGSASLEKLVAVFKDAEGKPIRPKQSSYHYLWKTQSKTRNFGTGGVEIPIPLTIDDIRNKIVNLSASSGGGGGGTASIPTQVGFNHESRSSYVDLHKYISTVQNAQDVMAVLLNMYCGDGSDGSMLAVKPTGGFYSYKQLGWANPDPTILGLQTNQIANAYKNNRIIPLINHSGALSMNKNDLYVVIVGTKIYFCKQRGSYNMSQCYVLTALY